MKPWLIFPRACLLTAWALVASTAASYTTALAAVPATVPSPSVEFIASTDLDGDSDWEDSAGIMPNYRLLLDTANGVSRQAVATSLATVTHAYSFPGGQVGNNNGGGQLYDATNPLSLTSITGDPTDAPASFEIWFKPTNLTGGHQVLFEDGGGTGLSLTLNNNLLILRQLDATTNSEASYDITALAGDFIQAVGTFDTVSRTAALYVNGQPAKLSGPATADTVTDWSGGDAAAVGTRGGANMGGYGNGSSGVDSFAGQITIFSFYEAVLNGVEIAELYGDVAGTAVNYAHAGALLNFDASFDLDADSNWEDLAGINAGYRLLLDTANGVTRPTGVSTYAGITAAYQFPGGENNGITRGAELYDAGAARSFESQPSGNASLSDVSFEIWFKPASLAGGNQVLFEDGGGTGISLALNNNQLVARHLRGGQASQVTHNITDITEFTHAIVTYSPNVGGSGITLFVNGVQVGTNTNAAGIGDWTGGDAAAVGTRGGSNMGGYGNGNSGLVSFAGQIAIMRFYMDKLDATAVAQKYNITQVSPTSVGLAHSGAQAAVAAVPLWVWVSVVLLALGTVAVRPRTRPLSN